MKRTRIGLLVSWILLTLTAASAQEPPYTRQEDVIYGRKFGTALTLDVFTPKANANGAALVFCVSGGWFSSHEAINMGFVTEFAKRGYVVFAVVHGSQPKFTIPEILQDMNRALRYIRFHAKDYKIDPERIGIMGGSAGGHLSLMQGTAGDKGDPNAKDLVDRTSSRVQAVACFFPPTDFLNWGEPGKVPANVEMLKPFRPPFDFHELDKSVNMFMRITDEKRVHEILRSISPLYHVTSDDPPTLIIHGDADKLVPIQQAKVIVAKLKEVSVPVELIVKKGAGHGWPTLGEDLKTFADWFDKYLKPATAAKAAR